MFLLFALYLALLQFSVEVRGLIAEMWIFDGVRLTLGMLCALPGLLLIVLVVYMIAQIVKPKPPKV